MIAIIAILAAILFPVFARARENARRSSCQSNLKQIGLGVVQYTQDYDEKMPPAREYSDNDKPTALLIQPYVKSTQIFKCPSNTSPSFINGSEVNGVKTIPVSYQANGGGGTGTGTNDFGGERPFGDSKGVSLSSITSVATTIAYSEQAGGSTEGFLYDTTKLTGANGSDNLPNAFQNHLTTTNFLFVDGHVKSLKPTATATTAINMWTNDNGNAVAASPTGATPALITAIGTATTQLK